MQMDAEGIFYLKVVSGVMDGRIGNEMADVSRL